MNYEDFNLLEAIEQIRSRETENLKLIEAIQKASAEPLKEFEAMRRSSLNVLEAAREIADRANRGAKKK